MNTDIISTNKTRWWLLIISLATVIVIISLIRSSHFATPDPTGHATEKQPLPTLEPGQRAELQAWLDEHGAAPELYIASKFKDHDIVFLRRVPPDST